MTESIALEGLRSVRGQPRAIDFLRSARAANRLASAYLFEGPDGVGKERCARALAQCAVCLSPRDDADACGQCAACRAVAANKYVDLLTVARDVDIRSQKPLEGDDVKGEIVKDTIITLQTERLAYHSFAGARFVIVRDAHLLNASASNALLKTLEEPPSQTHFVLVTSRPSELLVTVRSRCQRVRFSPLPKEVVIDIARACGVAEPLVAQAAEWADGSVSRAISLADEELIVRRKRWIERVLGALRAGKPGAVVEVAEETKDVDKQSEGELDALLTLLERHFRDEAIAHAADRRRSSVCAARAQLVRYSLASLDRNLNAQMVMESLLVGLREVRV